MATPTTVQAEAETEVKAPSSLETSASPALAFATEIKAQTTTATIESKTWDGEYPPLTTLWTMPDSCGFTMDLDHQAKDGEAPTVYIDWTIERGATTFSCYPPGMFEAGNSGTFSPANCPLGWTTEDFKGSAFEQVKTRTCCSKYVCITLLIHADAALAAPATPRQMLTIGPLLILFSFSGPW